MTTEHERHPPSSRNKLSRDSEGYHLKTNRHRVELIAESRFGPLSSQAKSLRESLANKEVDTFTFAKTYLTNSSIDTEIIRVLVIAAKEELFQLAPSKRREAYSARLFELGKAVLSRIWEDPRIWLTVVADPQALWALAWFAMLDNVDNLMLEWIKVDLSRSLHNNDWNQTMRGANWRGNILARLIEVGCITAGNLTADTAIRHFVDIVKWRQLLINSESLCASEMHNPLWVRDVNHMQLGYAAVSLTSNLARGSFYRTSSQLWDEYAAIRPTLVKPDTPLWHMYGIKQAELDLARLDVFHPKRPNTEKCMALLGEMQSARNKENSLNIPETGSRRAIRPLMQRAWVVSKSYNQESDAEWISKAYEATFDERFQIESGFFLSLPPNMEKVAPPGMLSNARKTAVSGDGYKPRIKYSRL